MVVDKEKFTKERFIVLAVFDDYQNYKSFYVTKKVDDWMINNWISFIEAILRRHKNWQIRTVEIIPVIEYDEGRIKDEY